MSNSVLFTLRSILRGWKSAEKPSTKQLLAFENADNERLIKGDAFSDGFSAVCTFRRPQKAFKTAIGQQPLFIVHCHHLPLCASALAFSCISCFLQIPQRQTEGVLKYSLLVHHKCFEKIEFYFNSKYFKLSKWKLENISYVYIIVKQYKFTTYVSKITNSPKITVSLQNI